MVYSGCSLFITDKEAELQKMWGRQLVEEIIRQHFTLYSINLEKTESDFYGESKHKVYDTPVEVIGRIQVADADVISEGGIRRLSKGDISVFVYNDHLTELGVDIKVGDFIGFQGKFYEVFDPGYNKDSMNRKIGGDRDYYREVMAKSVSEKVFRSIEGENGQ